jgi:hypothetical protein
MSSSFPTMLNNKATMLGSLTRYDLVVLGVSHLLLSWMKVTGVYSLIINISILIFLKVIKKHFQTGFFKFLNDDQKFDWSYKIGKANE